MQDRFEELFSLIHQLGKCMFVRSGKSFEERTSTKLQFAALNVLNEKAPLTVGDLAHILRLSMSSGTQLIERLVKASLAKRTEDPKDRRKIQLSLTVKGKKTLDRQRKEIVQEMKVLFESLPEKDIESLIRIHKKLLLNLKSN